MTPTEISELLNWINRLELASMDSSNSIREFLITGDKRYIVTTFGTLQTLHGRPDKVIASAYAEAKGF